MKKKNKKNLLGIILAKSKSRRVKNKNFMKIEGKYMFQHVLDNAIRTKNFNTIHISTKSNLALNKLQKLKKLNKNYNKFLDISFKRPLKMSKDKFTMMNVVKYIRNKFKEKENYQHYCMLYATALNLKSNDIKKFLNFYYKIEKKYSNYGISCLTLTPYPAPIEWSVELKKNKEISFDNLSHHRKTSDTFKKKYFDAAGINVFNENFFQKKPKKFFGYILPQYKCVDIDINDDLILAKKLLNSINIK